MLGKFRGQSGKFGVKMPNFWSHGKPCINEQQNLSLKKEYFNELLVWIVIV